MGYEGTRRVLGAGKVIESTIELNNGSRMPIVGFGTYQITDPETLLDSVGSALRAGYRAFDCAAAFSNEEYIGTSLQQLLPMFNLQRSQVFVTSKSTPAQHGSTKAKHAVLKSLENVGLDYLDLYLIDWPSVVQDDEESKRIRKESWTVLEGMYKSGKLKSIGVSNYSARHLEDLLSYATIKPSLNQVEFHLYLRQPQELLDLCASSNILLQSYYTLGGTNSKMLKDPVVKSIAYSLKKSSAQVLLRWTLQEGFAIIPKSINERHILENTKLDFKLNEEHMTTLRNVTNLERYGADPENVP